MNMLNVAMLLLLVSLYVARVDGRFTTRFLGEQRQEHQHQHSFQGMFVPPFHQRIATSDRHQGDDEHDQSSEQSQLRFTAIERGNGNSSDFEGKPGKPLNALATLVTPLAALSLLGAASTVAKNPILLSITALSDRQKRSRQEQPTYQVQVLQNYLSQAGDQEIQQQKLMATYLSCSGFTASTNFCLDRVVCEYSIRTKQMDSLEKDVISIVLFNIMSNGYVTEEFKQRLRDAARFGRSRSQCTRYQCNQLK